MNKVLQSVSSVVSAAVDLVYPRTCGACRKSIRELDMNLCWDCMASTPKVLSPFCSKCGDPAEGVIRDSYVCGFCRKYSPGFDLARSAVRYRGPIRDALHAFKYYREVRLAKDLSRLMGACVRAHYPRLRPDAVAYVPLYGRRERSRTYNQSRLLAGALSRDLKLPLASVHCVKRVRETETQTGLNARQRRTNVREAFRVGDPDWIEGRSLLLVDDVMTTGATVAECAGTLREAGAAAVYVVTVARG